jgi:predicted phage terminase large subunit-like protein
MMNLSALQSLEEAHFDRELAKRGYIHFVEAAWHEVEPAQPFVNSWNVGAVCEHMEAVAKGQITRLVINVPPNTSKSMSCSVLFVPWIWTQYPSKKHIYGCYDDKLARRDSLRAKNLINSKWYQERWGEDVKINRNLQDTGEKYYTTEGGFRMITTIGGSVTGEHCDIQIVDDPIKPMETTGVQAVNQTYLKVANDWWKHTMSTRLVDYQKGARVIIMQRLHEADLAGAMLEEGGYEHLCLPMEFEPTRKCYTSIGWEDPRTEPGELLCPARFPQEAVDILFNDLGGRGSRGASAQLQQDPASMSGNLFKRGKEKYYRELPKKFDKMIQSWDCTFKETNDGSFVVGQVWGRLGADFYLIDQVRERWSFTDTCKQIEYMTRKWPKAISKLIEDKANGSAVMDHLSDTISGMIAVKPKGGKEARANAIEPYWEAGNIYLPHPTIAPWITVFLDEVFKFPAGKNDDQVDAMTQALSHMGRSNLVKLRAAMGNI